MGSQNPPQKYHPSISCQVPALNQQTVQTPLFRQPSPSLLAFRSCQGPLFLKIWLEVQPLLPAERVCAHYGRGYKNAIDGRQWSRSGRLIEDNFDRLKYEVVT